MVSRVSKLYHCTVLLVLFVLTSFCFKACSGEKIVIKTTDDFKQVLELSKKAPFDCDIELEGDLNLGSLLTVPIGLNGNGECIPFSGTFDGKGYSITGVQMDSSKGNSQNVALFCGFDDATVKNLKIGNTCSFSGVNASALCLDVLGDVDIENVINEASVTGTMIGAGFIGRVGAIGDARIAISRCENVGKISINDGNEAFLASFIAWVSDSSDVTIRIQNSINSGNLQATTLSHQMIAGGFISFVKSISLSEISIVNSISRGNITVNSGSSGKVGGFIGMLYRGNEFKVKMSNCLNYGNIKYHLDDEDDAAYCAGIIAYISKNTELVVDLNKCTNFGSIEGSNLKELGGSSGLVGKIFAWEAQKTNLTFIDCANYGNVESNSQQACGLFCVQPQDDQHEGVRTEVYNSLSWGNVTGAANSYGIANIINTASNVVSIGTVSGKTNSYLFWNNAESVSSSFGLDDVCTNCDDTIIRFKKVDNRFYTIESKDLVDNKLNDEVVHKQYEIGWDKQLRLTITQPSSPYIITSVSDFEYLALVASQGLLGTDPIDIILEADLNFSSVDHFIPWGMNGNGTCFPYSGIFEGNGHSITDLHAVADVASLFCGFKNAEISNINIQSSCSFVGTFSSALGYNAGGIVIMNNVTTEASIYAFGVAAGFLGSSDSDTIIYFRNCNNEGEVKSKGYACGFTCADGNTRITILNSVNKANVTADYLAFGFSQHVFLADNVINIGFVKGIVQDASFWDWEPDYVSFVSSIYGFESNCRDCHTGFVKQFERAGNGLYYIGKGKKRPVLTNVINQNAEENNYGLFWTKELELSEEGFIVSSASGKDISQIILITLLTIVLCFCL